MMKKRNLFFLLIVLSLFADCSGQKIWNTTTLLYFDTVCEINLFCSPKIFQEAVSDIERIFKNIEDHFSPNSTDAGSVEALFLFHRADEVYRNSEGCFDITVGPLSRVWGFTDKNHRVPDQKALQQVMRFVGMEKIRIKKNNINLKPKMSLDWGGIAKGYGIDKASHAVMDRGIQRGFINAGGDLFCWGTNPDNRPWQIGIKHPRKNGYLGILSLSGDGAATTGDYQRFFIHNGIRYHHVFDPKTGYPALGKQSVTVAGPETLLCDALSTAIFVSKNPEKILKHYPEYGAVISDSQGRISIAGRVFPFKQTRIE